MVRTAAALVSAMLVVVGMTACQPAPPPPAFTVTSSLAGSDADPGDGVCETGAPLYACTLPAAVEEANALGRGLVLIPGTDATFYPALHTTITGEVTLRSVPSDDGRTVGIAEGTIEVPEDSILGLEGIEIHHGSVSVDGRLLTHRFGVPSVIVAPTGLALISNSVLLPSDEPALVNAGRAFACR